MQKLKKILQSNYLYYFLFFFVLIFVIINFSHNNKKIFLNSGDNIIEGIVIDYRIKGDKIIIELNAKEKIIVNYSKNDLRISYGDQISVKGYIYEPSNNTIPNNFNYKKYLNNKGIYYVMKANSINVLKPNKNVLYELKNRLLDRINIIDSTGYLKAFILGDKSSLEIYNNYQELGVSHLFAISGMHIGLFSFIFLKILKRIKYKNIILDIWLLIYGFIVLYPPSVLRTIIFLFLKQINDRFHLDITNLKILFLTAFILIFNNYKIIVDISFLYSFACVFGLLYTSYDSNNKLKSLLYNSLIASLFSLPINLLFFYKFNLLSILLNTFYIPFISLIIYPLSLIVFIIPLFNSLLFFLISILESITLFLASNNVFNIFISFNSYLLIFYYFLLLIIIKIDFKYLILIIIYLFFIKYSYLIDNTYYTYFFDVGQGDSELLITSQHKSIILIDTGGNSLNTEYHVSNNIIRFLYSQNVMTINYLIITHGDYDHMGEAINLVNNFKVEKVIFNCGPYNDLEKQLIKVLDKKKIKYYSCIKELNINKNKLYFLQTKEYDNENDNSNVIYTELNGYKFMFMGDASITTEKEILSKYNLPDIDVLKVGHHGSRTSSSKVFIDEINPKYSVISVGKNNRYGHPNKEVLDNLKKSKIYRTDEDGSIMFYTKNDRLKIETCSP